MESPKRLNYKIHFNYTVLKQNKHYIKTLEFKYRIVGCGEGVSPFPPEEGSGVGAVVAPQKMFRFLSSKRRLLVHSGSDKTYF